MEKAIKRGIEGVYSVKVVPLKRKKLPESAWHDCGNGIRLKIIDSAVVSEWDCPITDWEGIEEGDEEIPYTKENAMRILKDYPDIAMLVQILVENPGIGRMSRAIHRPQLRGV